MILFTRFPHQHLFRLDPEYLYLDIPRYFPSYIFSRRPPYRLERSKDPLSLAKKLAEYMEEELIVSSRELSSGTLFAEGLRIEYSYEGGILRRLSVEYHQEVDEPYAIEGPRRIYRPLSMLLLDYPAVIIEFASAIGYSNERALGYPLPGTLYKPGDPLRTIPITIRSKAKSMLIVVALGGNAFIRPGQKGTYEEQLENVRLAMKNIADLIEAGHDIVLTHGNGPQVGALLLQNEIAKDVVPPLPLDVLNAQTQGRLGYMIQQSLQNELRRRGIDKLVATIVTQVVVDPNDPAFQNPTKFVGPAYEEEEAKRLMQEKGRIMKYDVGRGRRRVVPSPDPKRVVEIEAVKTFLKNGIIPITVGGGGIPVIETEEGLKGVEAVIDKDLASERVAEAINADLLMILTGTEKVYLNFNTPQQKPLDRMTVSEAKKYYAEGHFPPGNMGPKVLAAIRFVEATGKPALITSLYKAKEGLEGKTGTRIVPDERNG